MDPYFHKKSKVIFIGLIFFLLIGSNAYPESKANFEVKGIVEGTPRMAVVNGQIVQPGDSINHFTVQDITEKSVKFHKDDQVVDVEVGENRIITFKSSQSETEQAKTKKVPPEKVYISINPPSEFNFKSKADILKMRKKNLEERPVLEPLKYEPSNEVFGPMQDGKAWWGLLGMSYYGAGVSSINGAAKESRFILNPYLLVGLVECKAQKVEDSQLSPEPVYPELVELYWMDDKSMAKATYKIQDYWKKQRKFDYADIEENNICLSVYNARDFGYNYLYIDPQNSRNIRSVVTDNAVQMNQYIQYDKSCGYPAGCNCVNPSENDLSLTIKSLPATVHMSLWKNQPKSPKEKGDMDFIIEIV